jgi:hypothetical protein
MFVSALFFGANFGPNVIIIIIMREYSVNIPFYEKTITKFQGKKN